MVQALIRTVIENRGRISYINLAEDNSYLGWVKDFSIRLPQGEMMQLDLTRETDLFLLFVLATAWSKTGQWENAAFFTTYLKMNQKWEVAEWSTQQFVDNEITAKATSMRSTVDACTGVIPRKEVSFRTDFYQSVNILANNWEKIKDSLSNADEKNDYMPFVEYLSNLSGLGAGERKMRIKVPLILRELRCQKIYNNIPGALCCVPDQRVIDSAKEIKFKLPATTNMKGILKASEAIYEAFGDLYDIPLFAYPDLKGQILAN
jgi:hypothetical protein